MKNFIITIIKALKNGSFKTFEGFKAFFIQLVKGEVFKRALALLIRKASFFGTGLGGWIAGFVLEYLWDFVEPRLKTFINWGEYIVEKDVKGKFHWRKLEEHEKKGEWDEYNDSVDDIINV